MAMNFKALAEEFQRTNWKDPGTWHSAPKILVLLAILVGIPVAGFFALNQGQLEELELGQQKEVKLKEEYVSKKKQSINLDLHRQQLREIDTQFGALLKQLPNKSQMDALLVDINQAGLGRGLQFELFRPGQVVVRDYYAELPITIRISGRYHDLGAFAADIANLSRIVTLHDLAIAGGGAAKGGTPVLAMDATARTYRYLDQNEVAAQKKAQGPKKAGAKP
jgi:type IV pilus assembly protein PilO